MTQPQFFSSTSFIIIMMCVSFCVLTTCVLPSLPLTVLYPSDDSVYDLKNNHFSVPTTPDSLLYTKKSLTVGRAPPRHRTGWCLVGRTPPSLAFKWSNLRVFCVGLKRFLRLCNLSVSFSYLPVSFSALPVTRLPLCMRPSPTCLYVCAPLWCAFLSVLSCVLGFSAFTVNSILQKISCT